MPARSPTRIKWADPPGAVDLLDPAPVGAIKRLKCKLQWFRSSQSVLLSGPEITVVIYFSNLCWIHLSHPIKPSYPGNTEVFPRLSYLASAFEKYEFKQLKFIYAATSPFVTNGAFMGFLETDLLDEPPGTKGEILNHKNCFRSAVFEDCSFSVSKKDLVGQRYVRSTEAVESGRDNRLDHLGKLYFGTYGCASTTVGDAAGELWIDYEVDLISPCVPTSGIISAATGLEFSNTVAVPYVPIGGQNYLNCITASTQLVPSSSNYTDNLQNDARYSLFASGPLAGLVGITLPPGTYEVIMRLLGAKTATTTAGWNLYKYEDLLASLVSPTWWDGTLAGGGSSDYISYAAKWILNTNATNNSQSSSSGPVPSFYIRCAEAALAFTFANLRITKLADSPGRFITN